MFLEENSLIIKSVNVGFRKIRTFKTDEVKIEVL